jgi:hypothetical protein
LIASWCKTYIGLLFGGHIFEVDKLLFTVKVTRDSTLNTANLFERFADRALGNFRGTPRALGLRT